MKKIIFFCAAVLTCFAFVSCGQQSESDAVMSCYNAANQLIENGDYDAAKKMIDEAVSMYGDGKMLDSLRRKMDHPEESQAEQTARTDRIDDAEITSETVPKTDQLSDMDFFLQDEEDLWTTETSAPAERKTEERTSTTVPAAKRAEQKKKVTTTVPAVTQKSAQEQARDAAKAYVKQTPYSRKQIIDQLKKSGISETDTVYAADHCGADWNAQAVKAAQKCASDGDALGYGFSRDSLPKALRQAGFSDSEAAYAVDNAGIDWNAQAVKSAKKYTSGEGGYSSDTVKSLLQSNGFSESEAAYAADHAGIDWNEQAVKAAKDYLQMKKNSTGYFGGFSYDRLVRQLKQVKFTQEQAAYGADNSDADWYEQAVLSARAERYIDPDLTDEALLERLVTGTRNGGFTPEEAQYALANIQ